MHKKYYMYTALFLAVKENNLHQRDKVALLHFTTVQNLLQRPITT